MFVDTSWKMPLKGDCALLEDPFLKVNVEAQWLEVREYNFRMVRAQAEVA
jgi:hypothetical protein